MKTKQVEWVFKVFSFAVLAVTMALPSGAQQLFKGDGSDESGFVPL